MGQWATLGAPSIRRSLPAGNVLACSGAGSRVQRSDDSSQINLNEGCHRNVMLHALRGATGGTAVQPGQEHFRQAAGRPVGTPPSAPKRPFLPRPARPVLDPKQDSSRRSDAQAETSGAVVFQVHGCREWEAHSRKMGHTRCSPPWGVTTVLNFQPPRGRKGGITGDFVLIDKEVNPVRSDPAPERDRRHGDPQPRPHGTCPDSFLHAFLGHRRSGRSWLGDSRRPSTRPNSQK